MTSPAERPDRLALEELEQLLQHLTEELAGWRRRSLAAERELAELRARGGLSGGAAVDARLGELERENQALRQRVDAARERVALLVSRLSFLEQTGDQAGATT